MLKFNSNNFFILMAAMLLSGIICAYSAMADIMQPQELRAYQGLTAVEMQDAKQPKYHFGLHDLSRGESRYKEELPMQLSGSIKRISKAKYKPSFSSN